MAAFAIAYLTQAWRIPLDPWSAAEIVTARTMPIGYGFGLLAVSIILLIVTPSPPREDHGQQWMPLLAHCAAIVAFGVLIRYAGLWVSTAILLLAGLLIAGERRVAVLLAAPVATAVTAWLLISVALGVYISPGTWFS